MSLDYLDHLLWIQLPRTRQAPPAYLGCDQERALDSRLIHHLDVALHAGAFHQIRRQLVLLGVKCFGPGRS